MNSAIRSIERSLAATLCLFAWSALFASAAIADTGIAGSRPAYSDRAIGTPPNADAMRARMWVPEIDLGYVPQGLTVAGASILLATYNSEGVLPRCRLFRIDPRKLAVTGRFDMPLSCAHAGGLAYAGGKRLFVSDTDRLFEIDLDRAFDAAGAGDAVVRALPLRFPVRGSFLAYSDGALWIGVYTTPEAGRIYRVPLAVVESTPESTGLGEEHASASLEVARKSQGAAFDMNGFLWISQSDSQFGTLQKIDAKTGRVLSSHEAVAGIEDLGFDAEGMLWAVSEAGARRWRNWPTYYPVLFSIDTRALR
ncbi:MAG: hypothetical protein IH604_20330 [Burkholderiales bacterium]|nr:hypothetical protein [Burkholderiales bacterium]